MPEDQITFRTDPAIKARIAELVAAKEYRNLSEFVNQAILLKFQLEQITLDGRLITPSPIEAFFDSPNGRELLREILLEARER